MNEQMGRSMGVDEKGRMIIPKEFKEKFLKVREWVIFSEVNPHFEGMGSIKGVQNPLLEFSQILFFLTVIFGRRFIKIGKRFWNKK